MVKHKNVLSEPDGSQFIVPATRTRPATTRQAARFDFEKVIVPDSHVPLHDLLGISVKPSSFATYGAHLRTLQRFLCKIRGVQGCDPVSCSQNEFLLFLWNWLRQCKGPAKGFRAALLLEHRRRAIDPSFLETKLVKIATRAASTNAPKTSTGVLDRLMFRQWKAVLRQTPPEEFGAPCKTCRANGVDPKLINLRIALAGDIIRNVPLRPGNLQDLRSADDLMLERACNLQRPKMGQQKQVPMSEKGRAAFLAAKRIGRNEYLFPKCIAAHLDRSLRFAEELFDWPRGLVFSANCLRHTCMTTKIRKIENARIEADTAITARVARGTYGRSMAQRLSKK